MDPYKYNELQEYPVKSPERSDLAETIENLAKYRHMYQDFVQKSNTVLTILRLRGTISNLQAKACSAYMISLLNVIKAHVGLDNTGRHHRDHLDTVLRDIHEMFDYLSQLHNESLPKDA